MVREAARVALETHRRGPRDHTQCPDPRQIGDDLVGEPVAEVLGVGIRAQVGEGQHDDRLRIGRRARGGDEPGIRERPEGVSRLAKIAQATGRLAHETPFDKDPDLPREVGRQRLPIDAAAQDGSERVGDRAPREGSPTAQHLEQEGAERPDIGVQIDRRSDRLLG